MNDYNRIRQAVMKAYPQRGNDFHTSTAKTIYDKIKNEKDDKVKAFAVESELKALRELSTKARTESLMFFIKANESNANKRKTETESHEKKTTVTAIEESDKVPTASSSGDIKAGVTVKKVCRAQNEAEEALNCR